MTTRVYENDAHVWAYNSHLARSVYMDERWPSATRHYAMLLADSANSHAFSGGKMQARRELQSIIKKGL